MRSLICLLLAVGSAINYSYYPTNHQTRNGSELYDYEYAGQTNPPAPNIESDILDADNTYNYDFDANGNLIKRALKTDSNRKTLYFYDYDNRLTKVENYSPTLDQTMEYIYDPLGNLVKRHSSGTENKTTTYTVDIVTSLPVVLIEEEAGGPTAKYTYGDDLLKVSRSGEYYYFYDGLGSTRTITNGSGTVTAKYVYYPYGQMVTAECQDATWNDFLFTGQAYDRITGLVYLRARHYDPATGRFAARDTYGGQRTDPVSLHRYAYCGSDPVNRIDPSGHMMNLGDMLSAMSNWATMSYIQSPIAWQMGMGIIVGLVPGDYNLGPCFPIAELAETGAEAAEKMAVTYYERYGWKLVYKVPRPNGQGFDLVFRNGANMAQILLVESKKTSSGGILSLLSKLVSGSRQCSVDWSRLAAGKMGPDYIELGKEILENLENGLVKSHLFRAWFLQDGITARCQGFVLEMLEFSVKHPTGQDLPEAAYKISDYMLTGP